MAIQKNVKILHFDGFGVVAVMLWRWKIPAGRGAGVFRGSEDRRHERRSLPAEVLHAMDVGADGCLGEVAALQLLNQKLT
jgi:hypothetical protein